MTGNSIPYKTIGLEHFVTKNIKTKWNGKRWLGVVTMPDDSWWEFIGETEDEAIGKCQSFLGLTDQLMSSESIKALLNATKRAAKKGAKKNASGNN